MRNHQQTQKPNNRHNYGYAQSLSPQQIHPMISPPRTAPNFFQQKPSSTGIVGEQMRMMNSRARSLMRGSQSATAESKLFPSQLLLLLSNEANNVEYFQGVIDREKERVERDFNNLGEELRHHLNDLKLSVEQELNLLYKDFLGFYGELKMKVANLREMRRNIINDYPSLNNSHHPKKPQSSHNPNLSNFNFLHECSKDQEYFRHHRLYEEITGVHIHSMEEIMAVAHNIIALCSQTEYYNNQKGSAVLKTLCSQFRETTKPIFSSQLEEIVLSTREVLSRNHEAARKKFQGNPDSSVSVKSDFFDTPFNQLAENKNKRLETGFQSYGLTQVQQPQLQPKPKKQERMRERPASNSDYYGIKNRESSRSIQKRQALKNQKSSLGRKSSKIKTARNQQNAIVDFAQSLQLIPNEPISSIKCSESQGALLCGIFVNNGKYLALGSTDHNIYVYETSSGKFITALTGHKASICTLTNFGDFFASGADHQCCCLATWDSYSFKMRSKIKLHSAALTSIVDLLDGCHLATAGYDKRIIVYDYIRGQSAFDVNSNKSSISSMVICNQSRKLISAGMDFTLCIWNILLRNGLVDDISLDRIVTDAGLVSVLRPMNLAPDFILAGNRDGKILLINIHTGQIYKTLAVGKSTVFQLIVLQLSHKPQYPIIISYCNKEAQLLLTRIDSRFSSGLRSAQPINIVQGCGIGPTMMMNNSGLMGIVSQGAQNRQISLYQMQLGN